MSEESKNIISKSGKRLKTIPFEILKDKNNKYILEEFNNSELLYEEFDAKHLLDKIKDYSSKENNFKTFECESLCVDIKIALTSIIEGVDAHLRYDFNPKFFIIYFNSENLPSLVESDEIVSLIRKRCNPDAEIRISIVASNDNKVIKKDYIKVRFIWIDKNIYQLSNNVKAFIEKFPDFDLNINLMKDINKITSQKNIIPSFFPSNDILKSPAILPQLELFNYDKYIYELTDETINLQNILNFSRYRRRKVDKESIKDIFSTQIIDFINKRYIKNNTCGSYFPFKYPEDYLWLSEDWEMVSNDEDEFIGVGFNGGELEENIDNDYSAYLICQIDERVELEINFNKLLDSLSKLVIGQGGIIDISLSLPYESKDLIPLYEIRIIRLLASLGCLARINFNIRNLFAPPEERAYFGIAYIHFFKK